MEKLYNKIRIVLIVGMAAILFSCSEDEAPSLYTLVPPSPDAPVINSVTSSTSIPLAGVSILTIDGVNFSAVPEDNFVYFNGILGTVESASSNQLAVRTPIGVFGDTIQVKVAVFKVENFSNIYETQILSPIEEYYKFDPLLDELPWSLTFDDAGNMYVSVDNKGVKKITPDRNLSDFVPDGTESKWFTMRIDQANSIYASKNLRGIWKINEGVAPPNAPWVATATGTFLADFDFDNNLNLWAVGANSSIFKIKQDQSITTYPFSANLRAVRYFDNYLYVAGIKDGVEGVWRLPVDANGDLGSEELYFNFSNNYANGRIKVMTFAADGDLYLGTDKGRNPIVLVRSDGTFEELYPGIIDAKSIESMYWPGGTFMYLTRLQEVDADGNVLKTQTVFQVEMLKQGASYYKP